MESEFAVVVVGSSRAFGLSGIRFAGIGELRVKPHKFSVVEFGVETDFVGGVFWNVHAEMYGVGRAGRNQMHKNSRPTRPRIAFVDDVAVGVDLLRAVEMRAGFDWAFAVILDFATPEKYLTFFIGGLQLEPDIECVHRAARKKVANFAGSNDHVHQVVVAATTTWWTWSFEPAKLATFFLAARWTHSMSGSSCKPPMKKVRYFSGVAKSKMTAKAQSNPARISTARNKSTPTATSSTNAMRGLVGRLFLCI